MLLFLFSCIENSGTVILEKEESSVQAEIEAQTETEVETEISVEADETGITSSGSEDPNGVYNDSTLVCSRIEDAEDVVYLWKRGAEELGSERRIELRDKNILPEDTITCQTRTINASGVLSSASVSIANRAPRITGVAFFNPNPEADETLICDIIATDPDGETLVPVYDWQVNGASPLSMIPMATWFISLKGCPILTGGQLRTQQFVVSMMAKETL